MVNKAKKQKILYKEDENAKEAELEQFLFSGLGEGSAAVFKQDDADIKALVRKGAPAQADDSDDEAPEEAGVFFIDKSHDKNVDLTGLEAKPSRPAVGKHIRLASESESEPGSDNEELNHSEDESDEQQQSASASEDAGSGSDEEGAAGQKLSDEEGSSEQDEEEDGRTREASERTGGRASTSGRAPVWSDANDAAMAVKLARNNRLRKLRTSDKQTEMDGVEYAKALRKQHRAMHSRTSWATIPSGNKATAATAADVGDDDETDPEALLRRAGGLLGPAAAGRLPAGSIETTRLRDANQHEPSNAVVDCLEFHPGGSLIMAGGLDKKIRLFQVDGLRNPHVQTVYLEDMPLHRAAFASGGAQIVASGRRPHFYIYDLQASRVERVMSPAGCPQKSLETFAVGPSISGPGSDAVAGASGSPGAGLLAFAGDGGYVPLVSLRTRQWVGNLKMNGSVRTLAFTPDGNELMTAGGDGVLYCWDLRTRRCRYQLRDHGNVNTETLALSRDGSYLATGASSGVVNLYHRPTLAEAVAAAQAVGGPVGPMNLEPAKELLNLTTTVDCLSFNADTQMLAMSSRLKRDSLRLVHLPSLTVFSNWPTTRTPLHYVHSTAFSPGGGLLAIGNAKGRVLLYRLHHYQTA